MAFNTKPVQNRPHKSHEFEDDNPNSVSSLGKNIGKGAIDSFSDIGTGIFDQLLGKDQRQEQPWNPEQPFNQSSTEAIQPRRNERITLFSLREQKERQEISQIKELLKQIRQEMHAIRQQERMFEREMNDFEKLTLQTDPKAGIYHVRFLELVLKVLHSMRVEIGESRTWLQALSSKKGKRGSAFSKRSKEKGTQYSMSQELQLSRSSG
ncbi:MAG: DUF5660 family protein [Patescibacteria group bacterium]